MNAAQTLTEYKKKEPLVSVGIPTYDRPNGLSRTLELILAQTHDNIEVIVSDNASTDPEVEKIGRKFAAQDERVRYVRQSSNIGAMANFQTVLRDAKGEYFMWAADDDEWSPYFIETCLAASTSGESVGCNFDTLFRISGKRVSNPMPSLSPEKATVENIREFFTILQPSLIYGLHKRNTLQFFEELPSFDFVDCYVVLRQILNRGFRTINNNLYTAGVDAIVYKIKHVDQETKKLDYSSFYIKVFFLLLCSQKLNIINKLLSMQILNKTICELIRHHEKSKKPVFILARQIIVFTWRSLLINQHS